MFAGRPVDGHRLRRCVGCGMVLALGGEGATSTAADYTETGDYLMHEDPAAIEREVQLELRAKRELLDRVARLDPRARVLDVGSGAGFFGCAVRRRGLEAHGVEPSEKLRRYSRERAGFGNVYAGIHEVPGTFHAVCMFDVIEHLDPDAVPGLLGEIRARLRQGGLLVGNTPNFESLNIRLRGPRDPVVAPPFHLSYFTPATLDRALVGQGFRRRLLCTRGFNSNGFLRRSKFEPSFVERRPRAPLSLAIRSACKAVGLVAGRLGLGYQIHFVYEKPA